MRRLLLSLLIGASVPACLFSLSLLLERLDVGVGLAYVLWFIVWAPLLLGGNPPTTVGIVLALLFNLLLWSALAYLYLWSRGRAHRA